MRCPRFVSAIALFALAAGCGSSTPTTAISILGYTVVVTSAPPTTAAVGTSIPIAFTVSAQKSDGSSGPASNKSMTVTVTAGGGTINGAASTTVTTGADGSVSLTWVLGSTVGIQTIRGSVSSDKYLDVSVSATAPPVSAVTVTLAAPSITLGTTGDQATGVLKDAAGNVLVGRAVTWQSSNMAVATVSSTGIITTVAGGTSTITATSEGQSGSALLTVTAAPVSTVAVTLAAPSITLGTTGDQATAVLKDAGGNVLLGRAVTWQSSNMAVATISGTGIITTVGVGTATITATSETMSGAVLLTVTQSTWNAAWALRRQVTVTTTTASTPAGYSVGVQLDHASLVTAGKALANGNDVRVLYWTGSTWVELDRVLDAGSAWNTSTTTIWFKTQAAINATSSDNNYYVYYGNPAAAAAPANKSNVFLFADGFESGNLNQWTQLQGLWTVDNTRSHGGTFSLMYPAEGNVDGVGRLLVANPALNVADIYVDSWWYLNSPSTSYNVSQGLRMTGVQPTSNGYYTKLYDNSPFGWVNGKVIAGQFTPLTSPVGPLLSNSWIRVGTGMFGTTLRTVVNGVDVGSIGGLTELASGNIAFRQFVVPPGASWWIDDVIARRYVNPEPATTTGVEGSTP